VVNILKFKRFKFQSNLFFKKTFVNVIFLATLRPLKEKSFDNSKFDRELSKI